MVLFDPVTVTVFPLPLTVMVSLLPVTVALPPLPLTVIVSLLPVMVSEAATSPALSVMAVLSALITSPVPVTVNAGDLTRTGSAGSLADRRVVVAGDE